MRTLLFDRRDIGMGIYELSDETPGGGVVLRISKAQQSRNGTLQPADRISPQLPESFAAYLVWRWALDDCQTQEDLEFAHRYLAQWPDGPQLSHLNLAAYQADRATLATVKGQVEDWEGDLATFSFDQVHDKLYTMVSDLAEAQPGSPVAHLLRQRIAIGLGMLTLAAKATGQAGFAQLKAPQLK